MLWITSNSVVLLDTHVKILLADFPSKTKLSQICHSTARFPSSACEKNMQSWEAEVQHESENIYPPSAFALYFTSYNFFKCNVLQAGLGVNMSYVSRAGLTISISKKFLILINLRFNELAQNGLCLWIVCTLLCTTLKGMLGKNGDGCDWVPMIPFIT